MVWIVQSVTADGVIALKNKQTNGYIDVGKNNKFYLNTSYPSPLYTRHENNKGNMNLYYRANLNITNSYYITINENGEVDTDTITNNQPNPNATPFEIYKKVNVREIEVTVTNKQTTYPIRIKDVTIPRSTNPVTDMTYKLYKSSEYGNPPLGNPVYTYKDNDNGYLHLPNSNDINLELGAGDYVLALDQNNSQYQELKKPIRFTITRSGALRVKQADQEYEGFEYVSSETVEEEGADTSTTYPLLQIPHLTPTDVEITLDVQGAYADPSRQFSFTLTLPKEIAELKGHVKSDGIPDTDSEDEPYHDGESFVLKKGQTFKLHDVPVTENTKFSYTIEETANPSYDTTVTKDTNNFDVSLDANQVITLSKLLGSKTDPIKLTITETLDTIPATGLEDNALTWSGITVASFGLIAIIYRRRKRLTSP